MTTELPNECQFITFTTYGTWLHGDERGSVDRKRKDYPGRVLPADPQLETANRNRMKQAEFRLDAAMRKCVRQAIEKDCAKRGDVLVALNVRSNHVHVIVRTRMGRRKRLNQMKAWATRALREEGLVDKDRRVWTAGGNVRILVEEDDVRSAIDYVKNRQGPPLPEDD